MLRVFFGRHKCASTWITDILVAACNDLGFNYMMIQPHVKPDFIEDLREKKIDFLFCHSASYESVQKLPNFKGFHVIRDPRDLCISAYFSHLYSHSTDGWTGLLNHRKKLQALSKEEGLIEEMDFSEFFIKSISTWNYEDPQILEVRMEDLISSPLNSFGRILDFLDLLDQEKATLAGRAKIKAVGLINRVSNRMRFLPRIKSQRLPKWRLEELLDNRQFAKLAGRRVGVEDPKSHYRKGISGDWRNHFSKFHRDYFRQKYGDLLVRLGYEENQNW